MAWWFFLGVLDWGFFEFWGIVRKLVVDFGFFHDVRWALLGGFTDVFHGVYDVFLCGFWLRLWLLNFARVFNTFLTWLIFDLFTIKSGLGSLHLPLAKASRLNNGNWLLNLLYNFINFWLNFLIHFYFDDLTVFLWDWLRKQDIFVMDDYFTLIFVYIAMRLWMNFFLRLAFPRDFEGNRIFLNKLWFFEIYISFWGRFHFIL